VRVKLSIETNFQVSMANNVPVISIQNKQFCTNKNLAETSQLRNFNDDFPSLVAFKFLLIYCWEDISI